MTSTTRVELYYNITVLIIHIRKGSPFRMFCDNLSTYIMVTVTCHSLMKCKENLSFIEHYLDGIVCPDLRRGKLQSYMHLNPCGRVMVN